MANTIGAYHLTRPRMRFDYENRNAIAEDPYQGLRTLGPYDRAERRRKGKRVVRCVIVGRADREAMLEGVKNALKKRRLGKLHDVFELLVVETVLVPGCTHPRDEAKAYGDAVRKWLLAKRGSPGVELAFVLHDHEEVYRARAKGVSPYYSSKATLLSAGIPTQSICYRNVSPGGPLKNFEKYYLSNILTACYAKVGGTPWVIEDGGLRRPEITLGIATTTVRGGDGNAPERFVGISTIFKENGAFALWQLTPLQQSLEEYETSLEESVSDAIRTYEAMEGKRVRRIACHVSGKKAGRREIGAIRRALAEFEPRSIAADLVHISSDATLWLFDGQDASLRADAGVLAYLDASGRMALMHTAGRAGSDRGKFPARPLKLSIHSGFPQNGCMDVYQHIYDLRWMSWRGVSTAIRPVSIDYPARMAKLLSQLYLQEEVDALNLLPKLTKSAWFL